MSAWAGVEWNYPHGTLGSCVGPCPMRGRCHCGCGEPAGVSTRTHNPRGYRKGEPTVFANGHCRRMYPTSGVWQRNGVLLARILPLLDLLHRRHGSFQVVAEVVGIPVGTLWMWTSPKVRTTAERKKVSAVLAKRVVDGVLALRVAATPFDIYGHDVERRHATGWESRRAEHYSGVSERSQNRVAKRRERSGQSVPKWLGPVLEHLTFTSRYKTCAVCGGSFGRRSSDQPNQFLLRTLCYDRECLNTSRRRWIRNAAMPA